MSIAPCQADPNSTASSRQLPRPASGIEAPVPSPVHRLQAEIGAFGDMQDLESDQKLPGWMRVSFPVGASVLLWCGIAWMGGLIG